MGRRTIVLFAALCLLNPSLWAQARRTAPRGTPTPPAVTIIDAVFECPSSLGVGAQTRRAYCDVMTGRDQADGIIISLPPHTGPVTLAFQLHNRHLYSDELIKSGRGYRRYTATIGVLTADNTLLSRFIVQNEFRTAADLVERVAAEAGAGQVKAVAPSGTEMIRLTIPQEETVVSILGEKLTVIRPDGVDNFASPGRPVAVVSGVTIEYRPAPVRPAPRRR